MINLRHVYDALNGFQIDDFVGYDDVNPLMAEVAALFPPAWYALQILPAHERVAANHLIGRRFGVFLPEVELIRELRRRQSQRVLAPMFPGYVFVFCWLSPRNHDRIRSCPGVWDFLRVDELPAIIPDAVIDGVRAVENRHRPLMVEQEAIGRVRKVKRSWRRHRRISEQLIAENEIVSVHTWSALRDALSLDGHVRNRLLHQVLGLT